MSRPAQMAILLAIFVLLAANLAAADGSKPALIVKFRSEGPAALEECAEGLSRAGRTFASATRDGSSSLDETFRRHRLEAPRVLFPSGEGRQTLARRRAALARRFESQAAQARGRGLAAARAGRADPDEALPDLAHLYRVEADSADELAAALERLALDPHVEYVQPDHEVTLDQLGPPPFDDPFLSSSGTWGQPYADLWGPALVRAPEVWPFARGEGVVVAVVDTGVDQTHPDLAENLWVNPGEDLNGNGRIDPSDRNGIDDDANGFIDDLTGFDFANSIDANEDGDFDDPGDVSDPDPQDGNGHGTHVAGTIAAVANNGLGIVGIAPAARIMALKGFPDSGSASNSMLWRAVLYAAENGASVVNNSWSCGTPCPSNPLAEDVLELVEALGTVVVTSAGNASSDVAFLSPENGPRVITVGAIGEDSSLADFSNRGWLVDVVAPGGGPNTPFSVPVARRNILSLLARGTNELESRFIVADAYLRLAGTSMAAPHVAGAVAILRGDRPGLTPADVRLLVRSSARDLGSPGQDPEFGAGLLDIAALVDEPAPDLVLELAPRRVGEIHDPASGAFLLVGRAAGSDLDSIDVAIARGLTGRNFRALSSFGSSSLDWDGAGAEGHFTIRWDVAGVEDGPHVLRVRARLFDGRELDEYALVGLERNAPIPISSGMLDASRPALSGRDLVWQIDRDADSPQIHDLVAARFPDPGKFQPPYEIVFALENDQRTPYREGSILAWTEPTSPTSRGLFWCRIEAQACSPVTASAEPGSIGPGILAGGWLVWARTDEGRRVIEGCPLDRGARRCEARVLVDPSTGGDWVLHDFDGRNLLIGRLGGVVRCRLEAGAPYCAQQALGFPLGTSPSAPRLDADLLAFEQIDIETARPPGCAEPDPRPSCARQVVVVTSYLACLIDGETGACDPIPVSGRARAEQALGLDVSGRRVAWAMAEADELPAIRFCELDPVDGTCPAQRIGGTLATQAEPALDGQRIVWSDRRSGAFAIDGLVLPDLRGPSSRTIKAGLGFSIGLDAESGSSTNLRFEIEGLEGLEPEAANAAIVDGGRAGGRVALVGRIPETASGRARWRIHAIGDGGLSSRHVIELDILARPVAAKRPFDRRVD